MRTWRESLRRSASIGDSAALGATLGNLGARFDLNGDLDSATYYLERARVIATRMGDHRTLGNALGTLASAREDRGPAIGGQRATG